MAVYVNGLFTGELEPDAVVGGCINIFENVWPNPQKTIELAESVNADPNSDVSWEKASTIGDGQYQDIRTNRQMAVSHFAEVANNTILQNIHNQFYTLLIAATVPYTKRYGINEGLYHENYSLLKYSGGQSYGPHYDGGTDIGRSISALVYLNNDYEGGELEFTNFGLKIKPEPGMMILFPSNFAYTHIAHPVTNGTKYALVTWIKDREF